MSKSSVWFVLIVNIAFTYGQYDNETVTYYQNLIAQESARAFLCQIPQNSYDFENDDDAVQELGKFDYIIVGAGSAGAVIASRLSEITSWEILLLEVGGEETDLSDIPFAVAFTRCLKDYNWGYTSVPQSTSCQGFVDKKCPYPRGRVVGGSSAMNALMYVRGNRGDFDLWGEMGNKDWSYEKVLPYFKKSENFSHPDADEKYHGKDGELHVEFHEPNSPQAEAFIESNIQVGEKYVDYNAESQLGVSYTQFNVYKGKRQSTGRAFLDRARRRNNLTVMTGAFVTKILIQPRTKTAYGVLFSLKGKLLRATAIHEVIVSAGAINSPQLLMLSGIGPAEHLKSKGIRVIQNLAVGENLRDHTTYYGILGETNYTEPARSTREYIEDFLNGIGPFTIPGNAQVLGFYQLDHKCENTVPDLEIIMIPSNNSSPIFQKILNINDETYQASFGKSNRQKSFTFFLILLHPKSVGSVRLKSKYPFDYPLIDPRFLSHPDDLESMYKAIQLSLKIIDAPAFQELNATLLNTPLPACSDYEYLSKEYWYCSMKQLTFHIYHPIGTCKMGPNPKKGAVVNSRLRVHGIKNLRVADASIIPVTTSGHTNAVAIMIGERLADFIKEERGKL